MSEHNADEKGGSAMKNPLKLIKKIPWNEIRHNKRTQIIVALSLAGLLGISFPVGAWFAERRRVADMAQIHSPHILTISAAKEQDIDYLDLSAINLRLMARDDTRAKYYVFCVSGTDTYFYNLQLAYTTNNQFEYHIWPAEQCSDNDANWLYEYQERNENGQLTGNKFYYKKSVADEYELAGTNEVRCYQLESAGLINQEGSQIQASTTKHNDTYENYSVANVQKNAEPLYWQAKGIRSGLDPIASASEKHFVDYYILEVNWQTAYENANAGVLPTDWQELSNERETDIIYITAKSNVKSIDVDNEAELTERYHPSNP